MKVNLVKIDKKELLSSIFNIKENSSSIFVVQYADFNVLNYLYENKMQLPTSFLVYPDSTAVYFVIKLLSKQKKIKLLVQIYSKNFLKKESRKGKDYFSLEIVMKY